MRKLLHVLHRGHRDERGIAAVEFSLLTVPLLVFTFGVLDFGLGIWAYNNLSQATNEAARYAVVRGLNSTLGLPRDPGNYGAMTCAAPPPSGSVIERACTFAVPLNRDQLTITVDWVGPGSVAGTVTVVGHYLFKPILSNIFPFPSVNLKSQARMRVACCSQ